MAAVLRAHALLSSSAAHRWLNCPASALLEDKEPDKTSPYAEEGTLAHALCAKLLKEHLGMGTADEDAEIAAGEQMRTAEMDECCADYAALVLSKLAEARKTTRYALLLVEQRLDFSEWIPEGFGTADAIIIGDKVLEVVDFKYGKGVEVSAKENPQMMIYALGALTSFGYDYDTKTVRMTIHQPRIGNVSEWEISTGELNEWAENELKPKAELAASGAGKQVPGKWCQFCRVKHKCKALAQMAIDTATCSPDPQLVSKEMMESVVLPALATIKTWLSGVEEYALQQALSGVDYDGYKVVEGRSVRKIADPDGVRTALSAAGFSEAAYMKPPELVSLTELEKLTGKKKFATLCGEYVEKPAGKPALVPASDKRPAMNLVANDFKDFMTSDE